MYDGVDMTAVLFGANARHVPAWLYVVDQGPGLVTFVGSSRVEDAAHPLRYGSIRSHQLIVGEVVVRPHEVIATDTVRGYGLSGLVTDMRPVNELLEDGEYVVRRSR